MREATADTTSPGSLIAADRVEGTAVYNRQGDHLGAIKTVMIDKPSGKVAYAVMSFGGFLGIGEKYHPLPWSMLTYHRGQRGYVVDLDKAQLEGAPSYDAATPPDYDDPAWGRKVHDYYRVPPYWM
ncbi:PRC-barrel domain-containing protein [Stella sp.]|uniref:PRC-barrel domain-containing protein n=1 Tax=Stella sp. TaxID=2912054 RepID=UPI0035B43B30